MYILDCIIDFYVLLILDSDRVWETHETIRQLANLHQCPKIEYSHNNVVSSREETSLLYKHVVIRIRWQSSLT